MSTGPKTVEGIERIRLLAVTKHGRYSKRSENAGMVGGVIRCDSVRIVCGQNLPVRRPFFNLVSMHASKMPSLGEYTKK
jgi:hypothetical protein